MKYLISILIILVSIESISYSQILHVDGSSESTSPDGSSAQPYKTIQQAVNNAQPGDAVLIHSGIYREEVEIPVDSITIKAAEGDNVVLSGAEVVVNWSSVGDEVYKAIVPWDVTEGNQSNQVFVDGQMIHLARWPKQSHPDFVTKPTYAVMDEVKASGSSAILVTENDFDQPKERWLNAKAWVNFSHNNHDGQGWSGTVSYVSTVTKTIKITDGRGTTNLYVGNGNFDIGRGTDFYLFGPDSTGVYATGGPKALLARGEWWKNSDTLYVRLPNGEAPANHPDSANLVEAKKRIWAFRPPVEDANFSKVEISDLKIFAASILTDNDYYTRENGTWPHDAVSNVFSNIKFDYITHFIDNNFNMSAYFWMQKSGLVLGGINNSIINCTFNYSAGTAISAYGQKHKILGNKIYDVNYHVLEVGAINGGGWLEDPEIGHNFIYNSPLVGIVMNNMHSADTSVIGDFRIHHNLINHFMLLGHDGGALNGSAGRSWDNIRVDHNLIMNAPKFLSMGIYFDFGGNTIIDHNVVFNSWSAMALNRWEDPLGKHQTYNNTIFASSITRPGYGSSFRDGDGEWMTAKNNLASGSWFSGDFDKGIAENNVFVNSNSTLSTLVEDYTNYNYMPVASATQLIDKGSDVSPYNDTIVGLAPDIGAYEFGVDPWLAGPEGVITDIELSYGTTELTIGDTLNILAKVYTNGFVLADPTPTLNWEVSEGGRFIGEGVFVAESETSGAFIKVSDDNLLKKYIQISVKKDTTTSIYDKEVQVFDKLRVKIYPNPANEFLKIEANKEIINYEIIDIKASKHLQKHISNADLKEVSVNVSMLQPGVYFVRILTGSEIEVLKFTKQ